MKKYNFNAGPSILPREVIEATAKQILDFNGSGLSLMEISHRAKDFQPVVDEAVALIKEILDLPEGYSVLFLGGGASLEFCMVPYNFLEKKAAYLNTGVWAKKAMKEAKLIGETVEVASCADDDLRPVARHDTVLVHGRTTAVATHGTQRRTHTLEYGLYLQGQLARRHQHDSLHVITRSIERVGKRQQECQCLARPRGRQQHHVLVYLEGIDGCTLHDIQLADAKSGKYLVCVHTFL